MSRLNAISELISMVEEQKVKNKELEVRNKELEVRNKELEAIAEELVLLGRPGKSEFRKSWYEQCGKFWTLKGKKVESG